MSKRMLLNISQAMPLTAKQLKQALKGCIAYTLLFAQPDAYIAAVLEPSFLAKGCLFCLANLLMISTAPKIGHNSAEIAKIGQAILDDTIRHLANILN